jgi:protein gp37
MTTIEWTDETWNPVVGCAHVSPGCDGCYAARDAYGRLSAHPIYAGLAHRRFPDELPRFTGEIRLLPERLDQPLRWRRPRMVFVNSMSDLFHPSVPDEFIDRVFFAMGAAERHTFQVLTKRPHRMPGLIDEYMQGRLVHDHGLPRAHREWPLSNVWLGTSIESDRYHFRANALRATPAAIRFLSVEPMLGPVPLIDLNGIDWVIVGCESGPRARPMDLDWARDLRDWCSDTGTAFFVKQLPSDRPGHPLKNLDDFPPDLRIREWP